MYPIAVRGRDRGVPAWLKEDGFGHISTFGGAELGCVVALKALEISGRPEVRSMVHYIAGPLRHAACARSRSCTPTGSSASARTAS